MSRQLIRYVAVVFAAGVTEHLWEIEDIVKLLDG